MTNCSFAALVANVCFCDVLLTADCFSSFKDKKLSDHHYAIVTDKLPIKLKMFTCQSIKVEVI